VGEPAHGLDAWFDDAANLGDSFLGNVDAVAARRTNTTWARWVDHVASNALQDQPLLKSTRDSQAYYNPIPNSVTLCAGVMLPPFYSPKYNNESALAALGHIVAHEFMHSMDRNGLSFDESGSYTPWLSTATWNAHTAASDCLVSQYTRSTLYGNTHSGARTVNENIADQLGMQIVVAANTAAEGTTGQRFFYSHAQVSSRAPPRRTPQTRALQRSSCCARSRPPAPLPRAPATPACVPQTRAGAASSWRGRSPQTPCSTRRLPWPTPWHFLAY
jgi:predicted metalloendopeptidase